MDRRSVRFVCRNINVGHSTIPRFSDQYSSGRRRTLRNRVRITATPDPGREWERLPMRTADAAAAAAVYDSNYVPGIGYKFRRSVGRSGDGRTDKRTFHRRCFFTSSSSSSRNAGIVFILVEFPYRVGLRSVFYLIDVRIIQRHFDLISTGRRSSVFICVILG